MAEELRATSGLPLTMDSDAYRLGLATELRAERMVERRLGEIKPVLQAPEASSDDRLLYYMTYDIRFPEEEKALQELGLRYDVTVLLLGEVGPEPIKTAGHYHPVEASSGLAYPEIYTVLAGRAHYLLQRDGAQPGEVEEAVLVDAEAGDKLLIPPGYGHISINPGPGLLVMANLVASEFTPDYGPIRTLGGGCYLANRGAAGQAGQGAADTLDYRPNPHYRRVPPLRRVRPLELPEAGLVRGVPLYTAFARDPLRFLYVARPGAAGAPRWSSACFWE